MSSTQSIPDMQADPAPELVASLSEVESFYAERNVLLTGGTGFLGRLLMERILRSCPNINTLFLLVRAKKEKSPEERCEELFDSVIFDRLRGENPAFAQKIVLIDGDMGQVGLGLSLEHRELLRSTHIVIHSAATVRFDDKMRIAASINVRGTQELLSLAKEMVDLKAFVHISTAYSNCVSNVIDEKFYPPPIDSDKLIGLLDVLNDTSLDHLTPLLLGEWPNTYAFTKAVAEDAVRRNCQSLPLCIVRPSIVMATYKEPIPGWINNVYGPTGMIVGAAIGLLRTMHCDPDLVADLIPADYVVNTVIVAAWETAKNQTRDVNGVDSSTVPNVKEPRIYNAVSSNQRPITWRQLMKCVEKYAIEIPSTVCIWQYCFRINKHRWIHNLYVIFLHFLPAAIVDSLAWLTGRKPMLWAAYKKILKFSSVIEYFALQEWRFHNNNVQLLWKSLGLADRSKFDFDIGSFDWEDYTYHHVRGLRVHILKDPLDTIPQGYVKHKKMKIAHYTLVTVVFGIILWVLWTVSRFIYGLW